MPRADSELTGGKREKQRLQGIAMPGRSDVYEHCNFGVLILLGMHSRLARELDI